MSVETAEAYFSEAIVEKVNKPVTRASHVVEIQKALPEYRFKQFLKLNSEGHRIVLSGAFLDIVEKPRESDLLLVNDYIHWFCEGGELDSFKSQTGTSVGKLEDLIAVMPEMIAAFYASRKTIGSVGLRSTIKVTPKKKKSRTPKNKEESAPSHTTNEVTGETVPDNTIDFPTPPPADEIPNDPSGELASVSPIRRDIVSDISTLDRPEYPERKHGEPELQQLDIVDKKPKVELSSWKDAIRPIDLDAPGPEDIDPETKLKAMVAAAKGVRANPAIRDNKASERKPVPKLERLFESEERRPYRHVDVFDVALRPGSVSPGELFGAINSMWGDAIDASVIDPGAADYLRARAAGLPSSLDTNGRENLKRLENTASAYPGRLMDEKLPNIKVLRSVLKQFAMGRTVDELRTIFPGAPIPLLLAGSISEVFRTRISKSK